MDKIIEVTKKVLNNEFFIVGDFYKFIDKESEKFEIRQLLNLSNECVSFYINSGNRSITSCYSLASFKDEKSLSYNIEHYKTFKEVMDLI
jgi:hypothetical protein